jgi:hypothetical protein
MRAVEELWQRFEVEAASQCARFAEGVARLMDEIHNRQGLPELRYLAFSLAAQCARLELLECARLAAAMDRACALLFDGELDPGQALPLLASGTETLSKALQGIQDRRIADGQRTPLVAAAYELETLFPNPGQAPKQIKTGPDVSLNRLRSPATTKD